MHSVVDGHIVGSLFMRALACERVLESTSINNKSDIFRWYTQNVLWCLCVATEFLRAHIVLCRTVDGWHTPRIPYSKWK